MRLTRLVLRLCPLLGLLLLAGALHAEPGDRRAALVIDYGDHAEAVCVTLPIDKQTTAADLLRLADQQVSSEAQSLGEAICKINDVGCAFPSQSCFCQCASPSGGNCRYWTYSQQNASGQWQNSTVGASRIVQPGDVDGWAWGLGTISAGPTPDIDLADGYADICDPDLATTATPSPTRSPTPTLTPTLATPIVVIIATAVPTAVSPTLTGVATSTPSRSPTPVTPLVTVSSTAAPTVRVTAGVTAAVTAAATTRPVTAVATSVTALPTRLLPTLPPVASTALPAPTTLPPPTEPVVAAPSPTVAVVAVVPTAAVSGSGRVLLPLIADPPRSGAATAVAPSAAPQRTPRPTAATPGSASSAASDSGAGYLAFFGLALALAGVIALFRRRR